MSWWNLKLGIATQHISSVLKTLGEWELWKLNGKPYQNGVGGPEGGAFLHIPLVSVQISKGRHIPSISGRKRHDYSRGRETFFPCLATARPMKNCYILNSQFPPMGFLFITTSPNIPFFSLLLYLKFTWFTITACPELQFFAAPK